jgi:flagellin
VSSVINTNVMSLNAQRNMLKSSAELANSMQRLSTGLRINSAKDDAAGLAIASGMTGQIRGMNQAVRNANDGISLMQTADGALQQVTDNLQRVRELAVQSVNGTNSSADREAIQTEVTALMAEIQRVSEQTKFNNTDIMTADFSATIQVGANDGQSITISGGWDISLTGLSVDGLSGSGTLAAATSALDTLDDAINTVSVYRANIGALQNRFESAVMNLETSSENLSAARSRIQDADFAVETASLTRAQILQQAGVAMLSQANSAPQNVLSLLKG